MIKTTAINSISNTVFNEVALPISHTITKLNFVVDTLKHCVISGEKLIVISADCTLLCCAIEDKPIWSGENWIICTRNKTYNFF